MESARQLALKSAENNLATASVTMNFVSKARMDNLITAYFQIEESARPPFEAFLIGRKALTPRDIRLLASYPKTRFLRCSGCPAEFDVATVEPGRQFECPKCYSIITVPNPVASLDLIEARPYLVESADSPYSSNTVPQEDDPEDNVITEELEKDGIRLIRQIGRGGMGVVYAAEDVHLRRKLALKLMLAGSFASDSQKARFEREAALVASINHPNIVAVHTFGNVRGQRYFTMDLIDGKSLDRRIAEKSITPHQAAEIASIICRAVHHAHDAGVVHRDLKPANILLDKSEKPYITDFGLAKAEDASKSLTESGVAIGTPHYMSPEQASGDVGLIDRRSDVYSIGVILYEMLCGRVPFEGTRAVEILMKIVQEEAPPPSSIKAGIPRDLEAICVKAMSYEPSKRYQSAEQMALDLESYLQGGSVSARPPTNLDRAVRMLRKYRISIAMFLVLTSSVAVAIYSMDVLGRGTGEETKIIGQLQDAEEKVGQGDLVSARAALSAARGMPESSSVTDRASRLLSTVKAKLLADFAREKDLERTAAIVAELRRFLPGDDATAIEKVGDFTGRLQIATDTTYSERGPSAAGSLFSSIALALNEQSTVIEPIRKYLSNKLSSDTAEFEKTSDTIDKAIECLQVLAMLNPSDDTYAKRIAKLRSAQANVLMEILEQALNLFGFGSVSVSGEHQGCEVEIEALSGSLKGTRQTFDLRLQQSFKLQNGLYLFRFKREGYIDIERRIPVVRDRDSAIEIRGADWVAKQ